MAHVRLGRVNQRSTVEMPVVVLDEAPNGAQLPPLDRSQRKIRETGPSEQPERACRHLLGQAEQEADREGWLDLVVAAVQSQLVSPSSGMEHDGAL